MVFLLELLEKNRLCVTLSVQMNFVLLPGVIKTEFIRCENTGYITKTGSNIYATGGIAGWLGSPGNYEFKDCSNTGTAEGDLFGRYHYAGGGGGVQPTGNSHDGIGLENGFGYLDFTPVVLTQYDCTACDKITLNWNWLFAPGNVHGNAAIYYVGTNLGEDEWRLTIDDKHYRVPFNEPIDGTDDSGVMEDTEHRNNALPTSEHWSSNKYELTIEGNTYTYYTEDNTQ